MNSYTTPDKGRNSKKKKLGKGSVPPKRKIEKKMYATSRPGVRLMPLTLGDP